MAILHMETTKDLLYCKAKIWGEEMLFVVDSGAALEGVLAKDVIPLGSTINHTESRLVRVGDGRTIWTEGTVETEVVFDGIPLKVKFAVLPTTASKALLGLQFLRRPEVQSLQFNPPSLTIKGPTIKLESQDTNTLHAVRWYEESYKVEPSVRAQALRTFEVFSKVDLFANKHNFSAEY